MAINNVKTHECILTLKKTFQMNEENTKVYILLFSITPFTCEHDRAPHFRKRQGSEIIWISL